MTRVGVVLVLLALALALPVAVLVSRALESARLEEEHRHRAVADRAFDEMEASLSRFLAEEEARPFDAYRFYAATQPLRRSPLAEGPREPFVLGYFQIDPDGSLHTPELPRDVDLAVLRGDFVRSPRTVQLLETLQQAWARADPPRARASRPLKGLGDVLEEEVATETLEADETKAAKDMPAKDSAAKGDDRYEVYRSFNLAAKRRSQRQQKVTSVPERALAKAAPAQTPPALSRAAGRAPLAQPRPPARSSESKLEDADERRDAAATPRRVRVALDPMVGRAAPNDRLLLYRTVVAGEQGYRQGMLIAWPALGDWLDSQVIAPSGLGRAKVRPSFFPADALADETGSARGNSTYLYRHQFAEPFDAFAVELGLPELPGGRGTGTIHALAALLAAVTTIGLFAVYRMVAVVVQFAERRNRFVAAVSHELKTPLTSIRMYGEMLRDGLVADESKRDEYYRTITDESERLSRLIDNVLDFSRLEKGEYEVTPSSGNVAAIVEEVTAKLRPHAAREGFTIRVETETDRPLSEAVFDRDALTQVIFNLVDNALKYARGATRKEVIISSTTDSEGGGVRVSVRDFGPGIPAGDLARVFDAFYRAEDELTRTTKGTGIGLALVKELMESIGGSVCAENAEGGGLRVSLRLPRAASS